ncbi:hypothetical protein KKI91_15860 [Xenorhabdus bovienii]|uniref:hypothetical protein n=1 Tax=Xenorhabdus bovienii TaxID=40576 RepID=UPI0023B23CCB|nr:hypothetical protein [Xenorhabdus bovienii]MDE9536133.1 hypothetical protein [Xenorhabdus bovienii]
MKKILLLVSLFFVWSSSQATNANSVNKLYKKTINNILDNNQCATQELYLNIPRNASDEDEDEQRYSTQFTSNVFVNIFEKNNKVLSIDISITPIPNSLNEQLPAFCVISSIQAAIDPSRTQNEYMKLDSKLYKSALEKGSYDYTSKNYSHSAFTSTGSVLIYRVELKDSEGS